MIANIGGVFIYSENPKTLAAWYEKALQIKFEFTGEYKAFYITYPYKDINADKNTYTVFSIMHRDTRPQLQQRLFTINFRVNDLELLTKHFKKENIPFRGIETHPEGKFGWLDDPEGNHIELWEYIARDID
jgi:predicted enzyme related to lactoylglutathione lyase